MSSTVANSPKQKVVFVMGATGAGKTRLSIDLATHFSGEIINSDKMQVYEGLPIVTNKVPESERGGVTHHLLGIAHPDSDFTAKDFCLDALEAIKKIAESRKVPIIVGGSNSFVEALVEDPLFNFRSTYHCSFLWVNVELPVLHSVVSDRIDLMVQAGLIDELRGVFVPGADNSRGIRKSIGVAEMDKYFQAEMNMDRASMEKLLPAAIEEMKNNTRALVSEQLKKIQRLRDELGWPMHLLDATPVYQKSGEEAKTAWVEHVSGPGIEVVKDFLHAQADPKVSPRGIGRHEFRKKTDNDLG